MDFDRWIWVGMGALALMLVLPSICWAGALRSDVLRGYQWKNRLLLVSAPSEGDSAFVSQMDLWGDQAEGFVDRDLVMYVFHKARWAGATPLTETEVQVIQKQLDLNEDVFSVILIGKDGGVKLRSAEPVSAEAIFGLIDGMPMRQREMRNR